MKKALYLVAIVVSFFLLSSSVEAKDYYVRIVDINGRADLHHSPYAWSGWDGTYYAGDILELIDVNKHEGNWYHVKDTKTGKTGYVSSNYAIAYVDYETGTNSATTSCEIEMANAGFPSSYWPYLCFLKEVHPNWTFNAIQTNLDWQTVVNAESNCGKSLFYTSTSKYIDSTCNYGYSGWEAPTKEAVAYYMDPRNFIGENFIFQFDYLKYDASIASEYSKVIPSILNGSAFYSYHVGKGLNFATEVLNAGKATDVNPVFLATRMKQELGTGTDLYNLYSGTTAGYLSLYNFYNIGVSDDCVKTHGTTKCGLDYARNNGWNSVINGIKGGATFLSEKYISVGQYNTYLQKYNVVPTIASNLYVNQYMTNIQAPMTEAKTTYANYRDTGYLNNSYSFHIPVYKNMDVILDNTGSGATGEDPNNDPSKLPVSTIVTNSGYTYKSDTITNITVSTSGTDIKGTLEGTAGHGNVTVMDKDDNVKTDKALATGDKISIKTEEGTKIITVVIYGDTSGDGKIDAIDLLQVQKTLLNSYNLTGVYSTAGDTNKDGKIDAIDLLQIQKDLLGVTWLTQ